MTPFARRLTNDPRECQLLKLDANDPTSPLVVAQEAYAPADVTFRTRVFYLQRDGVWIDEIARSTVVQHELAHIIFDTAADALQLLGSLTGDPVIRELAVTEADIQSYIARVQSAPVEELLRQLLARYRAERTQG